MAEKLDQKQIVDIKELLMSEVVQSEALINILDKSLIGEIKASFSVINLSYK